MQYSSIKQEDNWQDGQSLQDIEYFQAFYPESMKRLQTYVAAECDKMDYKGSPMYDEYPDRVMMNQMCDSICRSIPDNIGVSAMNNPMCDMSSACESSEVEEVEIYELLHGQQLGRRGHGRPPQGPPSDPPHWGPPPGPPHWGPPPGPPSWGPPPGPPPWGPPPGPPSWGPPPRPGRPNWTNDIVRVLLLNELQRRRCRNGRCF